MSAVRRNPDGPPRGHAETYYATRFLDVAVHVLAWTDRTGRGYELSLSPYNGGVVFVRGAVAIQAELRHGDWAAQGRLTRGCVVFDDAHLRAMGVSDLLVFEQMWPRLLARMARTRTRRNPEHGEDLDAATQAEIDEAFRTLPVRVYRGKRRGRR